MKETTLHFRDAFRIGFPQKYIGTEKRRQPPEMAAISPYAMPYPFSTQTLV
jgi:hypothetical protein